MLNLPYMCLGRSKIFPFSTQIFFFLIISSILNIPNKVSAEVARSIIGIIGNVISFFLFASPIPTFVRVYKKKSVEQFKPDPYIASAMNCMLWVFYGLPIVHPDSILVVTINGTGLVLELIYLTIFFVYAKKKG
ncbi:hypothetical protein SLE2022_280170 [Rubroshorea leprosula]